MESDKTKIDDRKQLLLSWLSHLYGEQAFTLDPLLGDASFRKYYRLRTSETTFIVMDAPPTIENCRSFVTLAKELRKCGINVPEIFAENIDQGFLVITDFGNQRLLETLTNENADRLYKDALHALVIMQTPRDVFPQLLLPFSSDLMLQEWAWFKEWFLQKFLQMSSISHEQTLDDCYHNLIMSATSQPQVFMHRDYHAANLMILPNNDVGILDFQDAFIGPITYDAVSLLRDCYISWPEEWVNSWVVHYWKSLCNRQILQNVDRQQFITWFDKMGMQRHLKTLVTFSRKAIRDQRPEYLKFVPRTLQYLINVSANYAELKSLHDFLQMISQSVDAKRVLLCEQ